jgi:hypothetical protein
MLSSMMWRRVAPFRTTRRHIPEDGIIRTLRVALNAANIINILLLLIVFWQSNRYTFQSFWITMSGGVKFKILVIELMCQIWIEFLFKMYN